MRKAIPPKEKQAADFNKAASVAKALAHPARLTILRMLANQKACVCSTLVEGLPLAQATVSQHLAVLKKVGLIQGTVKGTSVCYCLSPSQIPGLVAPLRELLDAIEKGPDACCVSAVPKHR